MTGQFTPRFFNNASQNEILAAIQTASREALMTHDETGMLPIHYIAMIGGPDILKAIHSAGISMDARTKWTKETGLHSAITEEMVEKLVSLGADMNVKNSNGHTPLHIMIAFGREEAARKIIELGADLNVQTVFGESFEDFCVTQNNPRINLAIQVRRNADKICHWNFIPFTESRSYAW